MKRVYDNCCGIDVHKKLIVACFKQGSEQEVREFGATTRELLELCRWLKDGDCEMVAMESTASFWKPLYNILEASELDAIIVNARHMKMFLVAKPMLTTLNGLQIFSSMVFFRPVIFRIRTSGNFGNLFVTERALSEKEHESLTAFKRCWKEQTSSCPEPSATSMGKVPELFWNMS